MIVVRMLKGTTASRLGGGVGEEYFKIVSSVKEKNTVW